MNYDQKSQEVDTKTKENDQLSDDLQKKLVRCIVFPYITVFQCYLSMIVLFRSRPSTRWRERFTS